jgi:hypothetical protein
MSRPTRKVTPNHTPAPELRPNRAELEELISKVKDLVTESPDKAVVILNDWTVGSERRKNSIAPKTTTHQQIRRKAS